MNLPSLTAAITGIEMDEQARFTYQLYIEHSIESYKESVPRSQLLEIGDAAVQALAGAGLEVLTERDLCDEVDRQIIARLSLPSFSEWRDQIQLSVRRSPVLLDSAGAEVAHDSARADAIVVLASEVSDDLIRQLAREPRLMYDLPPRKFEELVCELLNRGGTESVLTPRTRDGGRDIVARLKTPLGTFYCLVECKRYAPDRPVGVRLVRELFGVVASERVTQGVLVTTSRFTREAAAFRDSVSHQLSFRAYDDLVSWVAAGRAIQV